MEIVVALVILALVFFAVDLVIKLPIQILFLKLAGSSSHMLNNGISFITSLLLWSLITFLWDKITGHGAPIPIFILTVLIKYWRITQLRRLGNTMLEATLMDIRGVIVALVFALVNYPIVWY